MAGEMKMAMLTAEYLQRQADKGAGHSDKMVECAAIDMAVAAEEVNKLLADNERLRAREAALMAFVERVATMLYIPLTDASGVTTREICGGCARSFRRDDTGWFSEDSRHAPECVVEQARALLASADDRQEA